MDDNATCHRTLAVRDCLDSEGIQRLVWPARSPDLNPIENVWDALGRQVAGRNYPPTNKNTLIRPLTEEWEKLPQQLLDNVVQRRSRKIAYQLNEEAERTERPIRRLSKVVYGSTCADMQVDVMGECLSSTKHVVGTTSGCFYPRSNHWVFGGRPQCDKCGCRVRNCSQHRFTTLETISKLQEQLSGGSVVVVHEEPQPQMTEDCTVVVWIRRSLGCREHRNWRDNEWGRVLFTDESRFSLSSDSHRILIWRERGSRNHPWNIIERDRGAMGLQFLFMDDNAPCHPTVAAEQLLESENIERMDWPARSPDLNPIEHVWDFLGRGLAACTLPPVTIRELRLALQDEWAAMPQQLIDTLILSMGRRCDTCLAVMGDHIPY
ncbi:transposable element Tc3 transposase [Trichonephila clavipes]|nr:transposable element Tc3 transposase [Trichonephila clavipes]